MVADKNPWPPTASRLEGAVDPVPDRGDVLLGRLTPAERRVAGLVMQGLSNKEMATALARSEPTVKHQLYFAMQKLGVQSRSQLIVLLLTGRLPRRP